MESTDLTSKLKNSINDRQIIVQENIDFLYKTKD